MDPDSSADQASWAILSASVRKRSSPSSSRSAVSARSVAFSAARMRASIDAVFETVIGRLAERFGLRRGSPGARRPAARHPTPNDGRTLAHRDPPGSRAAANRRAPYVSPHVPGARNNRRRSSDIRRTAERHSDRALRTALGYGRTRCSEINHGYAGNWPLGPALEHVSSVFDFSLQGLYTGLL